MHRPLLAILLSLAGAGCAGGPAPSAAPSDAPERVRCDRLAARAIQAAEPAEAASLASQAGECYAALRPAT
jgi:hypothetical protein